MQVRVKIIGHETLSPVTATGSAAKAAKLKVMLESLCGGSIYYLGYEFVPGFHCAYEKDCL